MKDEILKKLIKSIDLDEPRKSFTDDIMRKVEVGEELSLKNALLLNLKKELIAEPSLGFSESIMADIRRQEAKISRPLFSRKVGLIIAGLGIILLLFALFKSGSSLKHLKMDFYFSNLGLNQSNAVMGIIEVSTSILPYIIPISVLFFIDYFLRGRQQLG